MIYTFDKTQSTCITINTYPAKKCTNQVSYYVCLLFISLDLYAIEKVLINLNLPNIELPNNLQNTELPKSVPIERKSFLKYLKVWIVLLPFATNHLHVV